MAQADPTVLDVVDFASIGRLVAKRVGVPAEAIRSEEEVSAIQQQRQAAEQQMQQAAAQQQALAQAGAAAEVSQAVDDAGVDNVNAVVQGLQ